MIPRWAGAAVRPQFSQPEPARPDAAAVTTAAAVAVAGSLGLDAGNAGSRAGMTTFTRPPTVGTSASTGIGHELAPRFAEPCFDPVINAEDGGAGEGVGVVGLPGKRLPNLAR